MAAFSEKHPSLLHYRLEMRRKGEHPFKGSCTPSHCSMNILHKQSDSIELENGIAARHPAFLRIPILAVTFAPVRPFPLFNVPRSQFRWVSVRWSARYFYGAPRHLQHGFALNSAILLQSYFALRSFSTSFVRLGNKAICNCIAAVHAK